MARVVLNPRFQADLLRERSFVNGLEVAAEEAARAARAIAPVETGDYRNSIKVKTARHDVVLAADDWKANFIEFGTVHSQAFAPLRRGVRAVGLRLKERGK